MEIRKPLLCLLPFIVAGLFATDDATSNGRRSGSLAGNGFAPGVCEIEPPAELLALADWPADSTEPCLGGSSASAASASSATLAEVVEARVRPVREVLLAGLEEPSGGGGQTMNHASSNDGKDQVANVDGIPPLPPQQLSSADADADGEPAVSHQENAAATQQKPRAQLAALLARAPVGDDELDELRGGFQTPDGLSVSFGIERVVYVNGVLQSTTALRVEDLGQLHGGAAGPAVVLPPGATVALIQNGGGNSVAGNVLNGAALGTIIQNSLDNQKIQTVTTINATVNSVQALQGLRMQNSLQEALNRATLMR